MRLRLKTDACSKQVQKPGPFVGRLRVYPVLYIVSEANSAFVELGMRHTLLTVVSKLRLKRVGYPVDYTRFLFYSRPTNNYILKC